MKHTGTGIMFIIVLLLAAAALCPAHAQEDDSTLIPVAPPEDSELVYNVPLSSCIIDEAVELKTMFDGEFSREYTEMVGARTGGDLEAIIDAGRELAVASAKVNDSIRAIGAVDVTFGIEGISRIIPAESALRDTMFGYVVWHEFSTAPAKGLMTRFEDLVGRVVGAGPVAGELAEELAATKGRLVEEVEARDARGTAELADRIVETAGRIDAMCNSAGVDAGHLMAVVDSLSANSGEELSAKWVDAMTAVQTTLGPAAKSGPAMRSLSEAMHLVVDMGILADLSAESVELIGVEPASDGNTYVSWTLFRTDHELAAGLEHLFAHGDDHEHDAGNDHGGEMGEHLLGALDHHVRADAMLAERAVEHASMRAGFATDAIERHYMALERYSDELSQDSRFKILEKVDRRFRENMEFGVMRLSIKSARDELTKARAEDALGVGHGAQALYHYQNAWLFCLNAGAAAERAEDEAFNR